MSEEIILVNYFHFEKAIRLVQLHDCVHSQNIEEM